MNPIRGNLRVVLSRPWATWTLFGGAVAVYGLLILMEARRDRFGGRCLSMFWVFVFPLGSFLLGRYGFDEITSKPLSFLLPGYRESLRKSSFLRAVRWGVAFSLYHFSDSWQRLLLYWDVRQIYSAVPTHLVPPESIPVRPGALEISLSLTGGFLGGMALCLLWTCGSLVQFRRKWMGAVSTGLGMAMPVFLIGSTIRTKYPFIVYPIFLPLSVFFWVYFWRCVGDPAWVKSGHRAIVLQVIEGPREIVVQTRSRPRPRAERPYLDRIRKGDVDALGRHVWGWLYLWLGPIPFYWRWVAVALLVVVLVQGYVSRLLVEAAFLTVGTLTTVNALPVKSSLLLPNGRWRRCHLTIVAAALATLLLVTISTAIVTLSWVLAALLPPISWGTHHLQYVGIGRESLWLVCLPVPWLFLSGPIGGRVPILRALILIAVTFLAIGQIFGRDGGFWDVPALLPVLLACGWAFFLLAAWITFRRWDLVGQRPMRDG